MHNLARFNSRQESSVSSFMASVKEIQPTDYASYQAPLIQVLNEIRVIADDIEIWFNSMKIAHESVVEDIDDQRMKIETLASKMLQSGPILTSAKDVNASLYNVSILFHWINGLLIDVTYCTNTPNSSMKLVTMPVDDMILE